MSTSEYPPFDTCAPPPKKPEENSPGAREKFKRERCPGCYNDVYNHGCGGAKECWSLRTAKLVMKKEVHIDQVPPWNQKAREFLSCFRRQRHVYVEPNRTC